MDANGVNLMNQGISLLKGFVSEMNPTPSALRPVVFLKYKTSTDAWAKQAQGYVTQNAGSMSLEEQSRMKTAISMCQDIANQTVKHLDSLVVRITQQMGGVGSPAPTATGTQTSTAGIGKIIGWGAAILFLAWIFRGRK
jgi:hypothetical protein